MLGGADKIVATTDLIKNNKWFAYIYHRISSIPNCVSGKSLQVEELVKLSPDVVIAADKKNKEELTKNGFNVLYPSFTNHADMKKSVTIMADAIGGDAPKIAQNERPKVLHIAEGKKFIQSRWLKYNNR